jgi:NAD(P)-dependent dehydrogenase (short-subunit alcohol dehydrogenase family)
MVQSRRLHNKVAVVTGAAQGIGKAIATRFADEGARVVVTDCNSVTGQQTTTSIQSEGGQATFVPLDVTLDQQAARMVETVISQFGRIDILCNNAGVGHVRSITEEDDESYDEIMNVNVRGVFHCCKHVLPHMVQQRTGSIINTASVASFVGFPRDAVYCASKGAVLMLTRQLALDYAEVGIRVNAVCPGFIDTPELRHYIDQQPDRDTALADVVSVHPVGRIGRPEEVAAAFVFLASDDASFITGASLVVDGGLLTH